MINEREYRGQVKREIRRIWLLVKVIHFEAEGNVGSSTENFLQGWKKKENI